MIRDLDGLALNAKRPRGLDAAVACAILGWAAVAAWLVRWTTDDAFISFRYARNLVEGHGLVFNVGERVEGFTNLAWTLWSALGIALGLGVESWAGAWSLLAYLACIALLWRNHRELRDQGHEGLALPVAAAGAALHPDWNIWATGGLETTPFTLLVLAGFLCATRAPRHTAAVVGAGVLAALGSLTRPDGILPAALWFGLLLRWTGWRSRWPWIYASTLALLWLPATAWRMAYYGDFFPNTYYAKSADIAWYAQGWRYLGLYLERYWILLLGPVLWCAAALRERRHGAARGTTTLARRQVEGAALFVFFYGWFVVRVGGDFMFARMLVPVTPFLLLLLEIGWLRAFRNRAIAATLVAALVLILLRASPAPLDGDSRRHGVANERAYYSTARVDELEHWAEVLARYFEGLDVRVAFYGDEARLVYRARFPLAVESHGGLTDRFVARQPLESRGRPGHEKMAPLDYLIERRGVQFSFSKVPQRALRRWVPELIVQFDEDVYGQLLHWDPALVATLRARGAQVPDFEGLLDGSVAALDGMPSERVARIYARLRRFYFDHVDDPAREAAFVRRLEQVR